MPRYFFHADDDAATADGTGHELGTLDEAKVLAVRYMGELLMAYPDRFWRKPEWSVVVTDERGLLQFTLRLNGLTA